MSIVSALTLVITPTGLIQWRIGLNRERRQRTVEMLLRYDGSEMLRHRFAAWEFLAGLEQPISTTADPLLERAPSDRSDAMKGFGSCLVMLRFFDLVGRLRALGHLDEALTAALFEEHRAAWAEAFAPLISGTREGEPHFALLQRMRFPLTDTGAARGTAASAA